MIAETSGSVSTMTESASSVRKALAHPTRREIIRVLRSGDRTAGELAGRFDAAPSTMSGHFSVLRNAGLIQGRRDGTTITYTLNVSVLEETLMATMEFLGVGVDDDR